MHCIRDRNAARGWVGLIAFPTVLFVTPMTRRLVARVTR